MLSEILSYVRLHFLKQPTVENIDLQHSERKSRPPRLQMKLQINAYLFKIHDARATSLVQTALDLRYCPATMKTLVQAGHVPPKIWGLNEILGEGWVIL